MFATQAVALLQTCVARESRLSAARESGRAARQRVAPQSRVLVSRRGCCLLAHRPRSSVPCAALLVQCAVEAPEAPTLLMGARRWLARACVPSVSDLVLDRRRVVPFLFLVFVSIAL